MSVFIFSSILQATQTVWCLVHHKSTVASWPTGGKPRTLMLCVWCTTLHRPASSLSLSQSRVSCPPRPSPSSSTASMLTSWVKTKGRGVRLNGAPLHEAVECGGKGLLSHNYVCVCECMCMYLVYVCVCVRACCYNPNSSYAEAKWYRFLDVSVSIISDFKGVSVNISTLRSV